MTFEDERFLDELVDKLCDRLDRIVVEFRDLRKEQAETTKQLAVIAENVLTASRPVM